MAIDSRFIAHVDTGNMDRVYSSIVDEMGIDPAGSDLKEMCDYAQSKMPNMYQSHDNENFNQNKASWNDDYFKAQYLKLLNGGFSRERLAFCIEMKRYLKADVIESRVIEEEQIRNKEAGGVNPVVKFLGCITLVGGAVAALFAIGRAIRGIVLGVQMASNTPWLILGGLAACGLGYLCLMGSDKK